MESLSSASSNRLQVIADCYLFLDFCTAVALIKLTQTSLFIDYCTSALREQSFT